MKSEQGVNPETLGLPPQEAEQRLDYRIRDVASFETEKGSVYSYDDEGQTSRLKTATGGLQAKQDVTVFVEIPEGEIEQDFLESIQRVDRSAKVHVLEKQPDNSGKYINSPEQVTNPDELYLALLGTDGKFRRLVKATLRPTVGYKTYDMRRYEEGGQQMSERHLGNRVTKIIPRG